jgi:predicted Na+-dependent transporter
MVSLPNHPIEKKRFFPLIIVATVVAAIFFYQLATRGNFKSSTLASIPPIVSCFLGGMLGLTQREDKNPWKNTKIKIFK